MKRILSSKIAIALFGFILGASSLWSFQKVSQKYNDLKSLARQVEVQQPQFHLGFSNDPFEEMRKMQRDIWKQFQQPDSASGFHFNFNGQTLNENVETREDEKFVYYDINIAGLDQKNFNVKVEDGQISISGEIEKKADESGQSSMFHSSFHKSFPAPDGVDAKRVEIDRVGDKVILKFPKLQS